MSDDRVGDYFISDIDDDLDDDELFTAPVVVPVTVPGEPSKANEGPSAQTMGGGEPEATPVREAVAEPAPTRPVASSSAPSREERLAGLLDGLMAANPDIQASALVSLDGFTMASALPEGMQEDRVGAMSAAILGLGERAAAELGRGELAQVYIEGAEGIVVLISAGGRAVLTALASAESRLGLVLYDMRDVAAEIGQILA